MASKRILPTAISALLSFTIAGLSQTVHAPTIPETVRKQGYYRVRSFPESLTLGTYDQLIERSPLILTGKVLTERTRLSADEYFVITEYRVKVASILKNIDPEISADSVVVVCKQGGTMTFEGKSVQDETPWFPPLVPDARYLLFLAPSKDGACQFGVYGGEAGTYRLAGGSASCHNPHRTLKGQPCDVEETQFQSDLKQRTEKQPKSSPRRQP